VTARPLQIVLGLLFALACGLSLHAGLLRLPFSAWPSPPFDAANLSMDQVIFAFSLMPRVAVSVLAGAMLGLSGALFQQLLRNPIADPCFFRLFWTVTAPWWRLPGPLRPRVLSSCLAGGAPSSR